MPRKRKHSDEEDDEKAVEAENGIRGKRKAAMDARAKAVVARDDSDDEEDLDHDEEDDDDDEDFEGEEDDDDEGEESSKENGEEAEDDDDDDEENEVDEEDEDVDADAIKVDCIEAKLEEPNKGKCFLINQNSFIHLFQQKRFRYKLKLTQVSLY